MKTKYSPLRFLASLGNGGIVVTFYLYLNFLIPHKNVPIIDFCSWLQLFNVSVIMIKILIILALLGVAIFSFRNLYYLFDNLKIYHTQNYSLEQKKELAHERLVIPLCFAMMINVLFILGSLFMPGLWKIAEYIFPFALLAFIIIGLSAFKMFIGCFTDKMYKGEQNSSFNHLSRMLPVFTFSMLAVGFGAPAAMSHCKFTAVIAAILSLFFLSISIFIGAIQLSVGFNAILNKGLEKESSTSIWIIIPILTIINITIVRLSHFLEHYLDFHASQSFYFVLITMFFSLQILLGLIGFIVMKKNGYFIDYVKGDYKSYSAYALICPGVAFFVLGMFFVHLGLIKNRILLGYSFPHVTLIVLLALVQLKTIITIFSLDRKLISNTDLV